MTANKPDWSNLLAPGECGKVLTELSAALDPFYMVADGQTGDTKQPAIRLVLPRDDVLAAAEAANGVRVLAPHLLPRMADYVWFSILEDACSELAHYQIFVRQDLREAILLKGAGQERSSILLTGTIEEVTGHITRHLWHSGASRRRVFAVDTLDSPCNDQADTGAGPGIRG